MNWTFLYYSNTNCIASFKRRHNIERDGFTPCMSIDYGDCIEDIYKDIKGDCYREIVYTDNTECRLYKKINIR